MEWPGGLYPVRDRSWLSWRDRSGTYAERWDAWMRLWCRSNELTVRTLYRSLRCSIGRLPGPASPEDAAVEYELNGSGSARRYQRVRRTAEALPRGMRAVAAR